MRIPKYFSYAAAAVVVLGVAAAASFAQTEPASAAMPMAMSAQPMRTSAPPSLRSRFDFLSRQTSNNCGLQPAGVMKMASSARLRGSCCAPMDYAQYVKQIHGLDAYRDVREIPQDPYNVSVGLAKQLFGFDKTIELTAEQQAVYDHAMKLSEEGGPCCCQCWRYAAFRGQAKELIDRRRYTAAQIAAVWDLEDGCGGNGESGGMMG
jgi:hypothetical protein